MIIKNRRVWILTGLLLILFAGLYGALRVRPHLGAGSPGQYTETEAALSHKRQAIREAAREENMKTIYLAGGCFWGTQKFLDQFPGVLETETGYANGTTDSPSYQDVCGGSGHAETVRVVYDESVLPLDQLLDYYFMSIDPLSVNRQGNDSGVQYRTGIYYEDSALLPAIEEVWNKKAAEAGQALAVEVLPLDQFYPAEEYHQKYLDKNPAGYCHIPAGLLHLARP